MFNPKAIKLIDIKNRATKAGIEFKPAQFMGLVSGGQLEHCDDKTFWVITGETR